MSKRQSLVVFVAFFVALAAGWWGRGIFSDDMGTDHAVMGLPGGGPCPDGASALYWKAPMDPTFVRDGPGKSPMGMDLVPECPSDRGDVSDDTVIIDPATVQNIGVRTMTVERRDLARSVRAVGRVAYDERRVVHVHTKVQGWVETLLMRQEILPG